MTKTENLLLATLRARFKIATHPWERAELARQIREQTVVLARKEFARKAAPVRRSIEGAY